MPTELVERPRERSQSPSGRLREQMRFLRDLSTSEEAGHSSHRGRRPVIDSTTAELIETAIFRPAEVQVVLQQLHDFQSEWQHRNASSREPLPEQPMSFPVPQPSSFLYPGQTFNGWQKVTHWTPGKGEQWQVSVTLQAYDPSRGQICGQMVAQDVPEAHVPVVTFFQGEIVDNVNHSFYTSHADWAALAETDIRHWSRFPAFRELRGDVEKYGGRALGLATCGSVFMRWKEQFFVSGGECRLTIAGFYYCCIDRATGTIQALYFDPASSPDQRLLLSADTGGDAGHAFAAHELA